MFAKDAKPGIVQVLRQQSDDRLCVIKHQIHVSFHQIQPPFHMTESGHRNELVSVTNIGHRARIRAINTQHAIMTAINRFPKSRRKRIIVHVSNAGTPMGWSHYNGSTIHVDLILTPGQ